MNTNVQYILTGTVCMEDGMKKDQFLLIEGTKILEIGNKDEIPSNFNGKVYSYPSNNYIVPGFIDIHIHGAAGADTMDATTDCIEKMATALVKEGTTSFLPTTITQEKQAIEQALSNVAEYNADRNIPGKAEVIGIHLEGPFINTVRKGAQPEEHIIKPNVELFKKWQEMANNLIKIVTLAPEQTGGKELVQYLVSQDVIPSIGHSDADFEQVNQAVDAGASHVTHLFNGMKGLHHREPGTAGAALLFNELNVEIIADGFHIHPKMIDLAVRVKGLERVVLITDSMRAKWLADGVSELGGQEVFVSEGKATLSNGSLAGSILKMSDGVKNIMSYANLSLHEAIKLATINPARELGLEERKGSLAPGKDADVVILDQNFDPILTICRGTIAYQ